MMGAAPSHGAGFLLLFPEMQPLREEAVLAPAPRIPISVDLMNGKPIRSQRKLFAGQEQFLLI